MTTRRSAPWRRSRPRADAAARSTSHLARPGEPAASADEPILDPELPIVGPHHHMWLHTEQTRAA